MYFPFNPWNSLFIIDEHLTARGMDGTTLPSIVTLSSMARTFGSVELGIALSPRDGPRATTIIGLSGRGNAADYSRYRSTH